MRCASSFCGPYPSFLFSHLLPFFFFFCCAHLLLTLPDASSSLQWWEWEGAPPLNVPPAAYHEKARRHPHPLIPVRSVPSCIWLDRRGWWAWYGGYVSLAVWLCTLRWFCRCIAMPNLPTCVACTLPPCLCARLQQRAYGRALNGRARAAITYVVVLPTAFTFPTSRFIYIYCWHA